MKFAIKLALQTFATVGFILLAMSAQAQRCEKPPLVTPAAERREISNQQLGISFKIPENYRTSLLSVPAASRNIENGIELVSVIDVMNPSVYQEYQCISKSPGGGGWGYEPDSISIAISRATRYTQLTNLAIPDPILQQVDPSIAQALASTPSLFQIEELQIAGQKAIRYNSLGYRGGPVLAASERISFFTPDRQHVITISVPYAGGFSTRTAQLGERLESSVLEGLVNSLTFTK